MSEVDIDEIQTDTFDPLKASDGDFLFGLVIVIILILLAFGILVAGNTILYEEGIYTKYPYVVCANLVFIPIGCVIWYLGKNLMKP